MTATQIMTIALNEVDSARLSRYLVEATYADAVAKRYEAEAMDASGEISDLQRRIEIQQRRYDVLQQDLIAAKAAHSGAISMLESIKGRVLQEAGASGDYIFSTTPNGTVTSLTLKES